MACGFCGELIFVDGNFKFAGDARRLSEALCFFADSFGETGGRGAQVINRGAGFGKRAAGATERLINDGGGAFCAIRSEVRLDRFELQDESRHALRQGVVQFPRHALTFVLQGE